MDLTKKQFEILKPLLPKEELRTGQRGRPWKDPHDVLNGILWILRTGAQWSDLPDRYPPYQTCHRRYQAWVEQGLMRKILRKLVEDLRDRGGIDLSEGFIDGMHAGAKKGVRWLGKPVGEKQRRSWQSQTALVFLSPLGSQVVNDMKSNSLTTHSMPASSKSSHKN